MIPSPYGIVGAIAGVVAIFGSGMYVEHRRAQAGLADELAQEKTAIEEAIAVRETQLEKDLAESRAAETVLTSQIEVHEASYSKLRADIQRLKPKLVVEESCNETSIRVASRLSPAMRLCFNAAVTGTPEAAAACAAFERPAAVPPT